MKNNQFRAYLDKYLKKTYNNTIVLTIDIDSNKRIFYLYGHLTGDCLGTIAMYFTNEYIEIAYSKSAKKACSVVNRLEKNQFDYCQLKQALEFINKAINYFVVKGGRYA